MVSKKTEKSTTKVTAAKKAEKPAVAKSEVVKKIVKPVAKVVELGPILDLKVKYTKEIIPALQAKFNYGNPNEVPKVTKVVINRGLGEAVSNPKAVQITVDEFRTIFGQAPVVTKSKKAIAAFKLRENLPIGCMLTIRGKRMYKFMNKLFNVSLPKIRDFRGLPLKAFDGQANYTLGLKEQLIFPEINFDKVDKLRGFNITFVTTAKTVDEARELLRQLGLPFRRN